MRLPRVRITIRTLMIATLVIALLLGTELMRRRSSFSRQLAVHCAIQERGFRIEAESFEKEARIASQWPDDDWAREWVRQNEKEAKAFRTWEAHYARLKKEYERVASRPWLPLPSEQKAP